MRYSLISKLAILLIGSAFSLAGHAQQLPCPLVGDYTNTDTATNSIYCDVAFGTLDNTATGTLTNLQGGTLAIQQAVLSNEGAIDNQAGASISLTNFSEVYNSGGFWNGGRISLTFTTVDNSGGFWNGGWISVDPDSFAYNSGFFYNGGTIQNQRALINLPAGYMDNSGTILVTHKLENDGTFINFPIGQISIFQYESFGDSRIENTGHFENYGAIFVAGDGASYIRNYDSGTIDNLAGASLLIYGSVNNSATINNSGAVIVDNSGSYKQTGGVTVMDGQLSSTTLVDIQGGKLMGTGTINGDIKMGGTMAPGDSVGSFAINGAYTQTSNGTFELEITSGGFDQLTVGGMVSLDGTLDILLEQGFDPAVGTVYKFLLFSPGELSGTFSAVENQLFNDDTEYWRIDYNAAGGWVAVEAKLVPETSTLLLLGTGIVGLAGTLRRRFVQ